MSKTIFARGELPAARAVRRRSTRRWGRGRATVVIGRHRKLEGALDRIVRFAASESPVLITGETGTGKELFARALLLMSRREDKPFLCVNCAQYLGEQLIASELFGHKRGSFTGAVAEHRGVFEAANKGTVFLDEIGDLPLAAQAMLLRTLSEREVVPVGGTTPRRVDVRIVAATSRNLDQMVTEGKFRADLYYRLKCLPVEVPPLRQRGEDWELIADYYLDRLGTGDHGRKRLSREAIRVLRTHPWPGNVRELRSSVETGYYVTSERIIRTRDIWEALEHRSNSRQLNWSTGFDAHAVCERLETGEIDFWSGVRSEFMRRELNRAQVRAIIADGLTRTRGSYKGLVELFGVAQEDYLKFMDFLRHHRLKPSKR